MTRNPTQHERKQKIAEEGGGGGGGGARKARGAEAARKNGDARRPRHSGTTENRNTKAPIRTREDCSLSEAMSATLGTRMT